MIRFITFLGIDFSLIFAHCLTTQTLVGVQGIPDMTAITVCLTIKPKVKRTWSYLVYYQSGGTKFGLLGYPTKIRVNMNRRWRR